MAESRIPSLRAPVRPLPPASRFALRIKDPADLPSLAGGLSLDQPINRFSAAGGRLAARLGPDEWLTIGAVPEADDLRAEMERALAGRLHAVVDVSQASLAFAVEGPEAENILNAGCPLDLDARHFPAGSATRTVLGKCEIILLRSGETEFRVECARSFDEYVHAFLLEAAALNATVGAH